MTSPTPERQKIQGLEGLRALMAWWVILGHLALALNLPAGLIRRNTLAVDVFIILSGFVIAMLIETKREAFLPFIIRRGFRIFPLYLVVLIASSLLLPVFAKAFAEAPFEAPMNVVRLQFTNEALANFWPHFLVHVPLLQGIVPNRFSTDTAFTIVGQAWSVSMEWQFYLMAPLAMFAIRRRAWLPLAIGLIALFLIKGHFNGGFIGQKMVYFAVGISSHLWRRRIIIPIIITAVAIPIYGLASIVPLAIWWIAFLSSTRINAVSRLLGHRVFVYLGERSYSSYLIHMIPLGVGMFVLNQLSISKLEYSAILIFETATLTMLISHFAFRWIEKPGINLGATFAASWINTAQSASHLP